MALETGSDLCRIKNRLLFCYWLNNATMERHLIFEVEKQLHPQSSLNCTKLPTKFQGSKRAHPLVKLTNQPVVLIFQQFNNNYPFGYDLWGQKKCQTLVLLKKRKTSSDDQKLQDNWNQRIRSLERLFFKYLNDWQEMHIIKDLYQKRELR